jgi:precorrin-6A/cobalt-precorrin-6A reductase
MPRILLLGGTHEAGQMAAALAKAGLDAVYSYAGRTAAPVAAPLPTRIGGFGGVAGLASWLRENWISHVIDATHPFAAQISRNAMAACAETGLPLIALERPAWAAQEGDLWTSVGDIASAVAALPAVPSTVFLAIGRQNLAAFRTRPEHRYVLRLVDPPDALPLPGARVVVDRGPFTEAGDIALMQGHGVQLVVAKNAGGSGASAKIGAARALGLPMIMIDRPASPDRRAVGTVAEVMAWLHDAKRGV